MKKLYLLFILFTTIVNAQEPFVMTWQVNVNDLTINSPIFDLDNNNYTIDFGDGTILSNQTVSTSHTYTSPGIYTITVSGNFYRININEFDKIQILTVQQWGDTQWTSMEEAFSGCHNLTINAADAPDLSQVTSMQGMFTHCHLLNQPLNNWNVSNVTNMQGLFQETPYNQPLNDWDVSNVTNMQDMFNNAWNFNQPLNNWDVSSVTTMERMFFTANPFNQSLDNWDVSNVTNMQEMFSELQDYSQPLNNWDVSNVTNMQNMFFGTFAFSQPLDNWDVSNVTSMSGMFAWSAFNEPINNWDVSSVTNMSGMFALTRYFNQPLENWNVSNVTDMSGMFAATDAFNQPIENWDVSSVTNMMEMFEEAEDFNQPLDNWDVSSVTDMKDMFRRTNVFNQPLNSWDVSNVTSMSGMFSETILFNQPIDSWDVSSITNMSSMFSGAVAFNQPLNNWNVSHVTDMHYMFKASVYNLPLNNWDVSNVIEMRSMFHNATAFNQDISSWNFNNAVKLGYSNTIQDKGYTFTNCGLDIENYDAVLLKFVQLELENKFLRAESLHYCDSGVRNYLINELGWTIQGDSLGEECQGNNISGTVIYDENANGCDTEDPTISNFLVTADNGEFTYSTISSDGEYDLRVMEGNYTVSLLNVPDYFTVNPASSNAEFTGFGNNEELNFCLTANEAINDLNITIIPVNEARPGFESHYQLVAENIGTQTITGASASFTYNETIQEFVSANQTPTSTTANQLIFDLGTMLPLENKIIDITMETFTPPTVEGNEIINFVATITPDTNDNTPADNTYNLDQVVVNSFDPNDKKILQGDEIYMEQTEGYLDYMIRFQNTGTASAITVRIEDVLHDNLDWTTFKPVTSSHDYRVEITNGNQVEFIFDNINLPHEAADEPGSHGFIAYKIKTVEDIAIGDVITGTAGIFFDYNLPIITNSADTEVIEFMGVNEFSLKNITLYPNPASTILYLQAENGIDVEEVKVFNLQGSELISLKQHTESINVLNLSAGIYLVIVQTNQGISKHRLIKK